MASYSVDVSHTVVEESLKNVLFKQLIVHLLQMHSRQTLVDPLHLDAWARSGMLLICLRKESPSIFCDSNDTEDCWYINYLWSSVKRDIRDL